MHYEVHDSSGTPLLLLHGGLFDIHQQFGELPPGKLDDPPTTEEDDTARAAIERLSRELGL